MTTDRYHHILRATLRRWGMAAWLAGAWMMMPFTTQAQNHHQTITVYGGLSVETPIVFTAPEEPPGGFWTWKLTATAASNWRHVSAGQHPQGGSWVITVNTSCEGSAIFECAQVSESHPERSFQYRFYGELRPCGDGGSGPPPPVDWEALGRTDGVFFVTPSTSFIGLDGNVDLHAKDADGGDVGSTWSSSGPGNGTIDPPSGNPSTVTFSADQAGVYTISAESQDSETPGLAEVKVTIIQVEVEDSSTNNFSPQLGEKANLNIKVNPQPPESEYPNLFFRLQIVRELKNGVDPQHIHWIEVNSSEPKNRRFLDFHTHAFEWDGITDAGANQAIGPDEFEGIHDSFHRKLPPVEAGKPVSPPRYHAVAIVEDNEGDVLFASEPKPIYVPQVVNIIYDVDAIDELKDPYLEGDTVVVSAFSDLQIDQLKATLEESIASYFGNQVNIRYGANPIQPYITFRVQKGTVNSPYGSALLDFGNTNPAQDGRLYVLRKRFDAAVEFILDPTFQVPVSPVEIATSMKLTMAHEIAHMLGLVAEGDVLDGTTGSHNKAPHTLRHIMNPYSVDSYVSHIGRNGEWSFREFNHEYLKFVLPTP